MSNIIKLDKTAFQEGLLRLSFVLFMTKMFNCVSGCCYYYFYKRNT